MCSLMMLIECVMKICVCKRLHVFAGFFAGAMKEVFMHLVEF